MQKLLLLMGLAICSLLLSPAAMAQEIDAPNYQQIRQSTNNSKSPNYYRNLMERYIRNDSTLTLQDYRNLYYGFTLREDFVPYQFEKDQLFEVRRELVATRGSKEAAKKAIGVAESVLADNPFDIPAIAVMAISYLQLEDNEQYELWNAKQEGLLDAITSSGDGEAPETAFHVICIEHEYEVLNRMGLELEEIVSKSNNIEYLRVKENAEGIEGIYFNYNACAHIYKKKYE